MRPTLTLLLMATVPISLSFLPNTSTRASLGMRVNRVFLFRALPYEVRPGENLVLEGSGFSKGSNKIYFNGTESATATSTNGTSMNLTVPGSLVAGEYKISISNILGSSENASIPIYVHSSTRHRTRHGYMGIYFRNFPKSFKRFRTIFW